MHLYSNNLSSTTTISSLIMSDFFTTFFSGSKCVNLIHNSSGSDDESIVSETPEAEIIKPGELTNYIRVLSRVDLLP